MFLVLLLTREEAEAEVEPPAQCRALQSLYASWAAQAAEDVSVAFKDQQKINKFAWNTSRITELKEETSKKQLQNLEDACDGIMCTDDNCLMIPYEIILCFH